MPNIEPVFDFVFTDHALFEMARRNIRREDVKTVLAKPEQREVLREGRAVFRQNIIQANRQKRISCGSLWTLNASHLAALRFIEQVRLKSIGDRQ